MPDTLKGQQTFFLTRGALSDMGRVLVDHGGRLRRTTPCAATDRGERARALRRVELPGAPQRFPSQRARRLPVRARQIRPRCARPDGERQLLLQGHGRRGRRAPLVARPLAPRRPRVAARRAPHAGGAERVAASAAPGGRLPAKVRRAGGGRVGSSGRERPVPHLLRAEQARVRQHRAVLSCEPWCRARWRPSAPATTT
jgi:hypothetical protein